MKTEFHLNGSAQLCLTPETELEKAILKDMSERAMLGKKISLAPIEVEGKTILRVSVEG